MTRREKVYSLVEELYLQNHDKQDVPAVWSNWTWTNHVKVVTQNAENLCIKYPEANADYTIAGALLHDIADAVMDRDTPNFDEECNKISRELLTKANYDSKEIDYIINDVIVPHSCRELMPTVIEGKVLATADAMAHFGTEFYTYFCWMHYGCKDYTEFKKWVLAKIERDINIKIFFPGIREQMQPEYEAIKRLFAK